MFPLQKHPGPYRLLVPRHRPDWLEYLEDEHDADFDRETINNYEVWVDEDNFQAYTLTEDLLVFATTNGVLEDILDRVGGEQERTLASDEGLIPS